jgi:hypothetical protein
MRTNHSLRFLLIVLAMVITSTAGFAQIGITVSFGPPALPVYEQPICPAEGWMWTPGYWAWDPDYGDYYWVPGTWVEVPQVGYLWTPGYWGWGGGGFLWHEGYWGQHVGFYGGINYGYGFFGDGFEGGRWQGRQFFYNRNVSNVNVTLIHNVYDTTVINRTTVNRISYNGGEGGIPARPTSQEEAWGNEHHIPPVAAQVQHIQTARTNPQLRASANHGKPPIAATARPGEFTGTSTIPAKEAGAPYHPPANHVATAPRAAPPTHASELQPHQAPAPVPTSNPKLDQKYQQQQTQLIAKQNQQHQQLAQKQEQDHQRLTQQNANEVRKQQTEQVHQQQTTQMEVKHTQQQQHLQQKQQPPPHNEGPPR